VNNVDAPPPAPARRRRRISSRIERYARYLFSDRDYTGASLTEAESAILQAYFAERIAGYEPTTKTTASPRRRRKEGV
jgi:hypothetical protein